MVFGPLIDVWDWVKQRLPSGPIFRKRHLSFISIHWSILIYPAGGIAYIDSLFFAGGAATQSGLNTVDVNRLNTYQQVSLHPYELKAKADTLLPQAILCVIPFIATPIFINTFVVFVRLYWFEKRFQHIVKEARTYRRTRSRSRTEAKDDREPGHEERGVNGRSIVVLHNGTQTNDQTISKNENDEAKIAPDSDSSDSRTGLGSENRESVETLENEKADTRPPLGREKTRSFHRDIVFADEVKPENGSDESITRVPETRSPEQHIAFLENQRNPKDKGTLRIPGPRDFDLGYVPQAMDDEDDGGIMAQRTTSDIEGLGAEKDNQRHRVEGASELNSDDHPVKRNITIDEPNHPRSRTAASAFSKLRLRRNETPNHDLARHNTAETANSHLPSRNRTPTISSFKTSKSQERNPMPYLSWQPTIGRNSAFVDLTEEQREELGGIEYRALKTLALVLIGYYVFFHVFGIICMLPWIKLSKTYGPVVENDGQGRVWWAFFTSPSMLNDLGFTLTPDSMESFDTAVFPLLLGTFLIIIGNTGFPCMLRLIIWTLSLLVPRDSGVWEELKFLLDHPRRCFTLLFPSKATWWLFWILVLLNGIDLVFFIILDLNDPAVTSVAPGFRVLDGLFQAASTRTAGFACVNLSNLHPGIQVSYMIMMYISVFPIAISVRRTNVYEEKSLGIYGSKQEQEEDDTDNEPSYVGAHLRRQLSFDLWYIFLGLFVIAIAEGDRLQNTNEYAFTLFSCLFEIVSAYGTVGLSLGYPNINASFSAEFKTISKLVILAMMLRGRHRGLPYELDRAILLPSESLHRKEDADASKRMQRRNSNASQLSSGALGRQQSFSRPASMLASGALENEDGADTNGHPHAGTGMGGGGLGRMMAGLARRESLTKEELKKHVS
ncbi:MAG: low affinity potassium transporter [Pycnora praestabilis]|nr:MAG: low affinity potassium transporter [Pycnora praestabilis]